MSDPDTLRQRIADAIGQHPRARAVNRALEVARAERAAALREAADIAHNVGAALYDDAGLAHAEGAWAVRDRLLTHADTTTEEPTT